MEEKNFLLRLKMRNSEAFNKAISNGYIQPQDDGHLKWTLGSQTLLAYFMGRLLCGDYGKFCKRKKAKVWVKGNRTFPDKNLCELFGVNTLKQLRQKRTLQAIPDYSELIDNLFDTTEK